MSTAGRIIGPGKLSEFFKFSRLSNFNFALDIPTTMWYNKLGEAKLSDNSELSEYSDVYSIPYFVYSIQTRVRITYQANIRSPVSNFYGSQGAALGAAFGRAGAASGSCEGAASILEPRSCVFEGAARRKFDKKFQILKNFS